MKIIALQGKPNVGKTSVLKLLMSKMLEEGAAVIYCYYKHLYPRIIDPTDEKWYTWNRNVQNLTILLQHKGKRVLITSVGDAISQIRGAVLGTVERSGMDISALDTVVCACHPHMDLQTIFPDAEIEYIEKHPDILLSTETVSKNDEISCQELFDEVKKA